MKQNTSSADPVAVFSAKPTWEHNLLNEIRKVVYVTLDLSKAPNGPGDAGAMVGHNLEIALWLRDGDAEATAEAKQMLDESTKQLTLAISELPPEKAHEFLSRMGEALCKSPTPDGINLSGSTPRTDTYLLLYAHRADVKKMNSIPELHNWVCSKIGNSAAGDLATFAKLCQRLGLKLAQPGRPKSAP